MRIIIIASTHITLGSRKTMASTIALSLAGHFSHLKYGLVRVTRERSSVVFEGSGPEGQKLIVYQPWVTRGPGWGLVGWDCDGSYLWPAASAIGGESSCASLKHEQARANHFPKPCCVQQAILITLCWSKIFSPI
jgi:hypothetical protein